MVFSLKALPSINICELEATTVVIKLDRGGCAVVCYSLIYPDLVSDWLVHNSYDGISLRYDRKRKVVSKKQGL